MEMLICKVTKCICLTTTRTAQPEPEPSLTRGLVFPLSRLACLQVRGILSSVKAEPRCAPAPSLPPLLGGSGSPSGWQLSWLRLPAGPGQGEPPGLQMVMVTGSVLSSCPTDACRPAVVFRGVLAWEASLRGTPAELCCGRLRGQ